MTITLVESLREKLNQIYDQPGGKEAARVILGDFGVDALHEVAPGDYSALAGKMDERLAAFEKAKDDGPAVPDEETGGTTKPATKQAKKKDKDD